MTLNGSCTLSIDQGRELLSQLIAGMGPKHIPITKAKILAQMVGFGIASYHPGENEIAFIA